MLSSASLPSAAMEAIDTKDDLQEEAASASQEPTPANTTSSSEQPQPAQDSEGEKEKAEANPQGDGEKVAFLIMFKKQTFNVEFGMDRTIGDLRLEVARCVLVNYSFFSCQSITH